MKPSHSIRVLIADDSATSRIALRRLLEDDPAFSIAGEARSGEQALQMAAQLRPSLILMDVLMPGMGGLTASRYLMQNMPTPIVIVSDLVGQRADLHFQALDAGALDIIRKPSNDDLRDAHFRRRFCRLLRGLSMVPLVRRTGARADLPPPSHRRDSPSPKSLRFLSRPASVTAAHPAAHYDQNDSRIYWIAIGASTGGPPALRTLLLNFAPKAPWPIFIVQHITEGFEESLAEWLAAETQQRVVLAEDGLIPAAGTVYVAPAGRHLVYQNGCLSLVPNLPKRLHCPSANLLFESLAQSGTAHRGIGVLLTGMGSDGAAGLLFMRRAGAKTIVQDEASSAVFGMPKSAADIGAAEEMLPLEAIGPRILSIAGQRASLGTPS